MSTVVEQYHHGARTVVVQNDNRPVRTIEVSTGGIVGTAPLADPLLFPLNQPVLVMSDQLRAKLGTTGTLPWSMRHIYKQAKCPVVVVRVAEGVSEAETVSNVIGGVDPDTGAYLGVHALLSARAKTRLQPRLLAAPGFTHLPGATPSLKNPVAAELETIADRLRAHAFLDGPGTTDADVVAMRGKFGNRRLMLIDPGVIEYDTASKTNKVYPASAAALGLTVWTDYNFGFDFVPSNKELKGFVGISRDVDYASGDMSCRARYLNSQDITTIIQDDGFRLWGDRTMSDDPNYAFINVSRVEDAIGDSIAWSHKWAVDRNITRSFFEDVSGNVNRYLRRLQSRGTITGGECFVSEERNPSDFIRMGKAVFSVRWTPTYPAEDIIFEMEITDDYIKNLFA